MVLVNGEVEDFLPDYRVLAAQIQSGSDPANQTTQKKKAAHRMRCLFCGKNRLQRLD
jgi:hypothetical protein